MGASDHDGPDQRRAAREALTLLVDYDGADDLVGDFTENLSAGGTFVQTDRELPIGSEVRLVLSFPGLLRPIALAGTVRWTRDGDQRGAGIEFADLDAEVRRRLEAVIAAIEQRDPEFVNRVVRVLVAEDNPHVSRLIRDGLGAGARTRRGYQFEFEVTATGGEALRALEAATFEAAIIDVYLPGVDGPTVIASLRKDPRHAHMAVIAVSAGGPAARTEALRAGADFFLDKPMRLSQILQSMSILMGLDDPT